MLAAACLGASQCKRTNHDCTTSSLATIKTQLWVDFFGKLIIYLWNWICNPKYSSKYYYVSETPCETYPFYYPGHRYSIPAIYTGVNNDTVLGPVKLPFIQNHVLPLSLPKLPRIANARDFHFAERIIPICPPSRKVLVLEYFFKFSTIKWRQVKSGNCYLGGPPLPRVFVELLKSKASKCSQSWMKPFSSLCKIRAITFANNICVALFPSLWVHVEWIDR